MIYSEYLKTEHWQNVKKEALQRADYHCQLCNNIKKLDVHHNNYGCLWHEKPSDVIVLCKRCHAKHHDKLPEKPEKIFESERDYYFWPVLRMNNGKLFFSRRLKPEFDALAAKNE